MVMKSVSNFLCVKSRYIKSYFAETYRYYKRLSLVTAELLFQNSNNCVDSII